MKKQTALWCLSLLLVMGACTTSSSRKTAGEWAKVPGILKNIVPPVFTDTVYDVTDYGAKSDTTFDSRPAILQAISHCNTNGGGTVLIPAGNYFIKGAITLKSNINLHIAEGARLEFSTKAADYLPMVLTKWEGTECFNYSPFIYAYQCTNVAVTGKGTIDGNGSVTFNGWHAIQGPAVDRLRQMGIDSVPVYQRVFGEGHYLRPCMIQFYGCKNVLVEDLKIYDSPFWIIHPVFCDNVTVRNVYIDSNNYNNDGCDPESCKNVLIENCTFDTGDDCIAIKSGRNQDGRKWNIPSENIIVRGCFMKNGHGGVVIGSEISGGYRNLFVENCRMDSPDLDRVIRIKTSTCRGGLIENVFVRNVTVGQCREAVLRINLQYENREKCNRGYAPTVRNVHLKNVTCEKSKLGVLIIGLDDDKHVYNVSVEDSRFNNVKEGKNRISGAKDVTFKNLYINGELVK